MPYPSADSLSTSIHARCEAEQRFVILLAGGHLVDFHATADLIVDTRSLSLDVREIFFLQHFNSYWKFHAERADFLHYGRGVTLLLFQGFRVFTTWHAADEPIDVPDKLQTFSLGARISISFSNCIYFASTTGIIGCAQRQN